MILYFVIILLFVLIVNAILIDKYKWKQNTKKVYLPRYNGNVGKNRRIFVSVASYRDVECTNTIHDMFTKASHPERVFVGLIQQNKSTDPDCVVDPKYAPNVRRMNLKHTQAKGPCYARYLASCLYRGEEFFFQIDSHTKFNKGWDTDLIAMINELPPKSVISNYPVSWDDDRNNPNVPKFPTVRKYARYYTFNPVFSDMKTKHEKHLGSSGCMLFMRGEALIAVPFDSELDWVFDGEEFLYSARLFSHGYDFYRPTKNVVYHFFGREDHPKFWNDMRRERSRSNPTGTVHKRMDYPPVGYFGPERTLSEYMDLLEKNVSK